MQEPVCVAVQVVSVGLAAKVSVVNGTYTCVCIYSILSCPAVLRVAVYSTKISHPT